MVSYLQPMVPQGYQMLYYAFPPLHLSCLSSGQERGNDGEVVVGSAFGTVTKALYMYVLMVCLT